MEWITSHRQELITALKKYKIALLVLLNQILNGSCICVSDDCAVEI